MSKSMSIPEVRREGFRALLDRLGPADALRFLQQFDAGHGDYTRERDGNLKGLALEDLVEEIKQRRKRGGGKRARGG